MRRRFSRITPLYHNTNPWIRRSGGHPQHGWLKTAYVTKAASLFSRAISLSKKYWYTLPEFTKTGETFQLIPVWVDSEEKGGIDG